MLLSLIKSLLLPLLQSKMSLQAMQKLLGWHASIWIAAGIPQHRHVGVSLSLSWLLSSAPTFILSSGKIKPA